MSLDSMSEMRRRLARYGAARDAWLSSAVAAVAGDARVRNLWAVGSLGRGKGDDLSDVDLVIVPEPAAVVDLIRNPLAVLSLPGEVLLRRDKPSNAPPSGAYLGVCVEVEGLPMWLDLYVWPASTAIVPSDATILVDRGPAQVRRDRRGFVELLQASGDRPPATVPEDDAGLLLRVCVAGKYLARGDTMSLAHVGRNWQLPTDDPHQIASHLRTLVATAADVPQPVRALVEAWITVCEAMAGEPARQAWG